MKSRGSTTSYAGFITVFALSGLFFYWVGISFDESRYIKPGSLDYYLLIHSTYVTKLPVPEKPVSVQYHYSCGDGPKPPSESIMIKSTTLTKNYRDRVKTFIKKYRLTEHKSINTTSSRKFYKTPDRTWVVITMTQEKNLYYIELMEMY